MIKYLLLLLFFTIIQADQLNLSPTCSICHQIVSFIQHSAPLTPSELLFQKIAVIYCTKKHLQKQNVCKGAIKEMTGIILNSLWRHYTDPHLVCHKVYLCPQEYTYRNLTQQIQLIVKDKPSKQQEKPTKRKILNVLHISDLHPDLYYTVGASAKCSEPVCCRQNVTKNMNIYEEYSKMEAGQVLMSNKIDNSSPAGYWGSLSNCDLPLQTFQLFLQEIEKMNLDLIIWTGDNTPHDIWQQTQDYNLNFTTILSEKLRKYTNATIIPSMGNHESAPVNVYDFEGNREDTLKLGLANAWRKWLDPQAYQMLRTKGYYSITLPLLNNLKIISLNCQAGNDQNWFLLRDPTDPGEMLVWIQKQLKQSQLKNQFVYIIGHIPAGSLLNEWSMRLNALVDRYSYIIRGQFFGHSHTDHIQFYHSMTKKDQVTGYLMMPSSLTTYSGKNPQYRVLQVDYDSLQVLDYKQYELHLEKNPTKEKKPSFEFLYSFLDAYGLSDMTISGGISNFATKLKNDPQTQIKYTYHITGGLEKGHAGKDVYCDTLTSPQLKKQCNGGTFTPSNFQKWAGKWKTLKHKQ